MQRDAPLEDNCQQERAQRSRQIAALPLLIAADTDDAEPEVFVHPDHVGEYVMPVVVRIPPLRGGADHVPLPRIGVDLRVVHPIPLPVGDVVTELHIVDAFGGEQRRRADSPPDFAPAAENGQPGGDFEASLKTYDALDVCAVLGAERRLNIATDFLQRLRERFDVRVAQVRILSYFCDRDAASHPSSAMGRGIGTRDG